MKQRYTLYCIFIVVSYIILIINIAFLILNKAELSGKLDLFGNNIYKEQTFCIREETELNGFTKVEMSVKQGRVFSPDLFSHLFYLIISEAPSLISQSSSMTVNTGQFHFRCEGSRNMVLQGTLIIPQRKQATRKS